MRMIFRIARKELELLFYSPVAWFLLVLFTLQMGMMFVGKLGSFMSYMGAGGSMKLFAMGGLWMVVQGYLYYYIPLLTMGIVSRELSSGSIKLLYSSPVKNSQIILGKYASMVIYALVMFAILLVYVIIAGYLIKDFEWMAVLTGWFGLFLLTCTYMAVGIFVSSLTSYQFVSAIGTFVVLILLGNAYQLWQEYDFFRDITYWLSIGGRVNTFVFGMICSEDLLYFPLVICLFLALTIIRLQAIRQKERFFRTCGKYVLVIVVVCLCGYLSSRPSLMGYYDATAAKINTISPESQKIVSELEGDLKITAYVNVLSGNYGAGAFPRFILQNRIVFEKFVRFKPDTKLKVVYYYDTITDVDNRFDAKRLKAELERSNTDLEGLAKIRCKMYKLSWNRVKTPEEMREMTDLTGERRMSWELVLNGEKHSWLHLNADRLDILPKEGEIAVAMSRLIHKAPSVGFVTGHGMRSVKDFDLYGYSNFGWEKERKAGLYTLGFDVEEVALDREIPMNLDILVMADMKTTLSLEEEVHLKQYINRGGNLFILGEPRRRDVMNPLLDKYFGVRMLAGTLVQYRRAGLAPDVLSVPFTNAARKISPFYAAYYVNLPTAIGLEKVGDRGFEYIPLAVTDTTIFEVAQKKEARSYRVWTELESLDYVKDSMVYNPVVGEISTDFVPMAALTRKVNGKEQRVVILGDADCVSNGVMEQQANQINGSIVLGTFHYLSEGYRPIYSEMPPMTDDEFYLTSSGWKILRVVCGWGLPILLVVLGLFQWIRRRSR